MKRIISVLMAAVLMFCFITGCGKNSRNLYSGVKLGDYVELEDYTGTEVDTQSQDFKDAYLKLLSNQINNNSISDDKIKEAADFETGSDVAVEKGDMVNIDYKGYNGDTAFDGGTAEGALLLIGSKTFIDDFEEELIGAKVGETVNVTAKFPTNYSVSELAGVEAVFVVKINSIAKNPEQIYKLLGFASADKFREYLETQTAYQIILDDVRSKAKIKDYPEKDLEILQNDVTEALLSSSGGNSTQLTDSDKKQIKENVVIPMMSVNMIMYYIFDKENLKLEDGAIESQNISQLSIAESYAVQDVVMEFLYNKATIK